MANLLGKMFGGGGNSTSTMREAIIEGNSQRVADLLGSSHPVEKRTEDGWTPLQAACWFSHPRVITEILKFKPDMDAKDAKGRTALHLAAFQGAEACMRKVLYNGADVDATDMYGLTALHKVAVTGSLTAAQLLNEYNAGIDCKTSDGMTPLHLAAWKEHPSVVKFLLQKGAAVNAQAEDGSTPLHEAVKSSNAEIATLLLDHGANPWIADVTRAKPMDLALNADKRELYVLLRDRARSVEPPPQRPSNLPQPPPLAAFWEFVQQIKPQPAPAPEPVPAPAPAPAPRQQQPQNPLEALGQMFGGNKPKSGQQGPQGPNPLEALGQMFGGNKGRQQQGGPAPNPRKQFEQMLGSVMFPNAKRQETSKPPPQAPNANPYAPSPTGHLDTHHTGQAGGTAFAQRRREQMAQLKLEREAAAANYKPFQQKPAARVGRPAPKKEGWGGKDDSDEDWGKEDLKFDLTPYGEEGVPKGVTAADGSVTFSASDLSKPAPRFQTAAPMPTAGLAAAAGGVRGAYPAGVVGPDGSVTYSAADLQAAAPPARAPAKGAPVPMATVANDGNDDYYDSDDAELDEFEQRHTTLIRKVKGETEGAHYTAEQARQKLEELDVATAKAQGWVRQPDARRRLMALRVLMAQRDLERREARNPLAALGRLIFSGPNFDREDEKIGVNQHVHEAVRKSDVYAQNVVKGPPVPRIEFDDVWRTTNGFNADHLLQEDAYGKVFRCDAGGSQLSVRVLDPRSGKANEASVIAHLEACTKLSHRNIVSLKAACPDRGVILQELPPAGNMLFFLQQGCLPTGEPLKWWHAVDWALETASGLVAMHSSSPQIRHGALCLSSLLLDQDACVKIADAGVHDLMLEPSSVIDDVRSFGEIMMQLMTMNTLPIDDAMRTRILAYTTSGNHITSHAALDFPPDAALAFESVALRCLDPGSSTAAAVALPSAALPMLQKLREQVSLEPVYAAVAAPPAASAPPAAAAAGGSAAVRPSAPPAASAPEVAGVFLEPPSAFVCPITCEVMLDPVMTADGFAYERAAIERWLSLGHTTSPMTNQPLSHPYLTPNVQLRDAIERWLDSHKVGAGW